MSSRLFVANIPFNAIDSDLESVFTDAGFQVSEVRIIVDRDTNRSRGYGFVQMTSSEDAQEAIAQLNGRATLFNRALAVKLADPRPQQGGRGGSSRSSRDW